MTESIRTATIPFQFYFNSNAKLTQKYKIFSNSHNLVAFKVLGLQTELQLLLNNLFLKLKSVA